MSDVTYHKKALELLEAAHHPATYDRGASIDAVEVQKAGVNATLQVGRNIRDLEGTTHRDLRLLADSVDDLARDLDPLVHYATRPPEAVPLTAGGEAWVVPQHISAVLPNGDGADLVLDSGDKLATSLSMDDAAHVAGFSGVSVTVSRPRRGLR